MIQIAYQPAYDGYHALFRILRMFIGLGKASIQIEHSQISSFYLAFPYFLLDARLTPKLSRLRGKLQADSTRKPYSAMPHRRVIFQHMRPFHEAAIQTLVAKGYLDRDQFLMGFLSRTGKDFPESVAQAAKEANKRDEALISIVMGMCALPVGGLGGLKERTGLMEHRYDAVRPDTAGAQTDNTFT